MESHFVGAMLRMLSGLLIWATHFVLLYVFSALACARGFWGWRWLGIGVVPWFVGVATLAAVAAVLIVAVRSLRYAGGRLPPENASRFVHWMTAAIGGLSLLAILWNAMPVLLVPVCG